MWWIVAFVLLLMVVPAMAKDICYEGICACNASVGTDGEGNQIVRVKANYVFGDRVNIQLVRLPQHATQGYYRAKDVQDMEGQASPVTVFKLGPWETGVYRVDVVGVDTRTGEAHISFGYGCATVALPPVCMAVADSLYESEE
jgi:hypothetical protein